MSQQKSHESNITLGSNPTGRISQPTLEIICLDVAVPPASASLAVLSSKCVTISAGCSAIARMAEAIVSKQSSRKESLGLDGGYCKTDNGWRDGSCG